MLKIVGVVSMAVMLSACGESDDTAAPAPAPSVATATVTATATAPVPASKPPKKPAAPRTTPKPSPVTVTATATATATVAGSAPPPIVVVPPPAAVSTPWPGTSLSTRYANIYRYDVAMVQQRLNDLGYGPLPVDGDFGPVTRSWVVRYQSDYGLYVDGFVGPVTWRSLFG